MIHHHRNWWLLAGKVSKVSQKGQPAGFGVLVSQQLTYLARVTQWLTSELNIVLQNSVIWNK